MAFFDNLLSGDYTGALIGAGATLGGALIASSANSSAADTAASAKTAAAEVQGKTALDAAHISADANKDALGQYMTFAQQGRDELTASKARGLGAIDAGTAAYTSTINPLLTPNPILLPTYRGLTAQQQTGEQDLLRNGAASLAASGLRGAGRAGIGAIMDQDRRYQEDARAGNDADSRSEMRRATGVAANARSGLAGVLASAGGAKANTEIGTGNQLAANLTNAGSTASNITASTGSALAGATATGGTAAANALDANGNSAANSSLANSKIAASTIGNLGSIIAGQLSPGPIGSSGVPSTSYGNTNFAATRPTEIYGNSQTGTV